MQRYLISTILAILVSLPAFSRDRIDKIGCTVGVDIDQPVIHLLFSADSLFEGGPVVLDAMKEAGVKGSFFFTGRFMRRPENSEVIQRVIDEKHYLGTHSDVHLLLATWDNRTPLVTPDSLLCDLDLNLREIERFGVSRDSAKILLPPYEWCAPIHAEAYRKAGFLPINLTPGIQTFRDYLTPDQKSYRTSEWMFQQLCDFEKENTLNGALIIIHAGVEAARPDKFYNMLPQIISYLKEKGYRFERF